MTGRFFNFGAWRTMRHGHSQHLPLKAWIERLAQDIANQTPAAVVALCMISLSRSDQMETALGLPQCRTVDDELIRRATSTLRDSDYLALASPGEIWVVLSHLPNAVMASLAASSLVGALEPPIQGVESVVTVRPMIGIALAARSGSTPLKMLKAAAQAESHARTMGHRYWVDVSSERSTLLSKDIVVHLQRALKHNTGLSVYYQPKVELISGKIQGVEALIRWTDSQVPGITPATLVDAAEQFGLITELTRFVLNTSLREYVTVLADAGIGKVWVNLSASMLRDAKLPSLLRQIVDVWGVSPEVLGLELTESTLLTDVEQSIATLNALVAQGFSLAIDDFGTGYSSLAYLRRLPLSELKIDQLFVRNMETSLTDRQIVRSVIDLAHNFQLTVVAEGAEHEVILDMLMEMGCNLVQGYVFSKALPANELVAWASKHYATYASRVAGCQALQDLHESDDR